MISARNLTKSFGVQKIVDDVSFDAADGEVLALLGPSGGGKSTVLRMVAGLETPDRGSVVIRGSDATHVRVQERGLGFVFQHYALFKHMTVRDNVAFGLEVRKVARAEIDARVDELLELVQLKGLGHRYPGQLSGGQRQRVALARALAPKPSILLLDEPFGALDAKVRQGLRNWLRRLHDELHMTSILVTHDQEEALEVADRVVVMNQAQIEQVGTPAEVFHQPASEFVMDFLGHVNVFRGRLEHGRAVLSGATVEVPGLAHTAHSAEANVYIRPHELEIERDRNGTAAMPARVARINPAGSLAKVALTAADGHEIQVDLPFERLRELQLQVGDEVFVAPKHVRVFVPDYVI